MVKETTARYWVGSVVIASGGAVAAGNGWRGFIASLLVLVGLNVRFNQP